MKRWGRCLSVCMLVIALLFSSIGVYDPVVTAKTKGRLSKEKLLLTVGDKASVTLSGYPKGKKVSWTLADKKLLKKVKSTKKSVTVKALKSGETSIRAKVAGKTHTCKVTIEDEGVQAYQDQDSFSRAVSDLILSHQVKKSAAIAATDRFFTARLIVQTKVAGVSFAGYEPTAIVKNSEKISILQFETSEKAKEAFQKIATREDVDWAEPDLYIGSDETGVGAAKPGFAEAAQSGELALAGYGSLSWGVERMGADVYAAQTPHDSITVAVVDTGVASHPFLSGRLVSGYDYVQNDTDPTDQHFHGTHVAGTVVDCTPGLNVKIMPVRVLDASGSGTSAWVGLGIRYAADHGAKIINLSLGGGHSNYEDSCIQYAVEKGVTVVCAAGNDSANTANFCPAHLGNVVVVAAIDEQESRAYFSNYGNSVDLAAPGMDIVSCIPGGGYESLQGTSMASPHIAGLAAMVKLNFPNASPSQVEQTLKSTCRDLGSAGWDAYFGYGIPDMTRSDITPPSATPTPTPKPTTKPAPTITPTATPRTTLPPATQPTVKPTTVPTYPTWSPTYPTWAPTYPTWSPVYPTWSPISPTWSPVIPTWAPSPTASPAPGGGTIREGDFVYRVLTSQTALITGYTGQGGNVTLPLELGGYPVSGIGDAAFQGNTNIRSLKLPGIVWIGEKAFAGCSSLTNLTISGIISGVASQAFANNASLSSIRIDGMLLDVQSDIFSNCPSLSTVTLIGMIDSSVQQAFRNCPSLKGY